MDTYEKKYNEALERARVNYKADKEMGFLADCDRLEFIFPELAESEGARIRREIMHHISLLEHNRFMIASKEECLAYLEKQKGKMTEEEFESSELFQLKLKTKYANGYQDGLAQKEQKPADYEAELKKCKDNPFYFYDKYVSIKLKPAEWGEEDERMRQTAIEACKTVAEDYENSNERFYKCKYWLETKLKSLRPQPEQEWDTHDKAIVNCIVCCLDGQFVPEAARKQCLEWFNKHRRDFLNRPSWKPSEEQMNCLCATVDAAIRKHNESVSGYKPAIVLKSLYEQLKKLI